MAHSVYGIATSEVQADSILHALQHSGFSSDDVSVLFPDQGSSRDFVHRQATKTPEGATAGASTGGIAGGALGWLAGIGALSIPGLGPFIAAGPIMGALSGAAVGAAIGGLTGALVGLGIPEYEAKRVEGKVRSGNILISIHTQDREERRVARDILERSGAEDVGDAGEAQA